MEITNVINRLIQVKNIDKTELVDFIASFSKNNLEDACRVACIIMGDYKTPDIPQRGIYDNKEAALISFDKFRETVTIQYKDYTEKWFTNSADAEKYSETGNSYRMDYSWNANETYKIKGAYCARVTSEVSLSYWNECVEKYNNAANK